MKKYILSIMFLSAYSMEKEKEEETSSIKIQEKTSSFENLAKLTKKEQITGCVKYESWKGFICSGAAFPLIYGIKQLYKKDIRFVEKNKLLLPAGIFLIPQALNVKKYHRLAETTDMNYFLTDNNKYYLQPNPLTILIQRIKKTDQKVTGILKILAMMVKTNPKIAPEILEMDKGIGAGIFFLMNPKEAAEILAEMDSGKAVLILAEMNLIIWQSSILEKMGSAIAAKILEKMHEEKAAKILEKMDPEKAAEILVKMDREIAAFILEKMGSAIAAKILEKMHEEKAAEILAKMDTKEATKILNEIGQEIAAEILANMYLGQAADILENMDPGIAVKILEKIDPEKAAAGILAKMNQRIAAEILMILEEKYPGIAVKILEKMDPKKAAGINRKIEEIKEVEIH